MPTKFGAYLFVFDVATVGASFALFESFRAFFFTVWGYFRVSIRLNYILEPTNVEYHFFVLEVQPYLF